MLLFFISFWFPKSTLAKSIYLISVFASGGFMLISTILMLFRQSSKKTIDLSKDEIVELTINSEIDTDKIKKKSEIEYIGNEIKTDSKIYEIDNAAVFKLIKRENTIKATNLTKRNSWLDISPKELFNDLMSMLWAAS